MKKKLFEELFDNLINSIAKESDNHTFDINSETCKNCKDFIICKSFHSMMDKIEAADIDDDIKTQCCAVLAFFKLEARLIDDFTLEEVIRNKAKINNFYRRFDSLKEFNHFDILVNILDNNDIKYLRSIILKIGNRIRFIFDGILDKNLRDENDILNILQKPQQEEKSYEDMSKEELIEELKKKK